MVLTPVSSGVFADRHGIRTKDPGREEPGPEDPGPEEPGPDRPPPGRLSRRFFRERPVYPIVDAGVWGERDPGPVLRALRAAGIRLVQLRGKGMTAGEFLSWAAAGVRGASGSGLRIVVNDRADVALLSGADGVHLGQDDVSPHAARRLLGEDAVIGLSTHTVAEVRAARSEPADYLAIGPVFPTGTKPDAAPVVALSGVREARRLSDGPLVAIGGIGAERITEVLGAGADAAAVISAVSGSSAREAADRARALLARAERIGL